MPDTRREHPNGTPTERLTDSIKHLAAHPKASVQAVIRTQDRVWFTTYVLLLVGLAVLRNMIEADFFRFLNLSSHVQDLLYRLASAAMLAILILAAYRAIRIYAIGRIENVSAQYNLGQLLKLVVAIVLTIIGISLFFVNWYAAAVSLGLISLVLGFALQTPISSFIGWIYILIRSPYRVGDRIKIGDAGGDVVEIGYFDTTMWEFGGPYLSADHPSGRLIRFPNSDVFSNAVYNYSYQFPYIWQEVKFQIAYTSDLAFVADTMQRIVQEEMGEYLANYVAHFEKLLQETAVHYPNMQGKPQIAFNVSENTWVEVIVRYAVDPKEAGQIKTRLIRRMLAELNAHPQRVLFPNANMR